MRKLLLAVMLVLVATSAFAFQGNYSWTNPSGSTATGIKVLRGTGADPVTFTQQGATLGPTATSFSDPLTGVALGTRICVKIVPTNDFGDAPATQVCGSPDVPSGVSGITIVFQP